MIVRERQQRWERAQPPLADIAQRIVGADEHRGGSIGVVAPGPNAVPHFLLNGLTIQRTAALAGVDHDVGGDGRVGGDVIGIGAAGDCHISWAESHRLAAVGHDPRLALHDDDQRER